MGMPKDTRDRAWRVKEACQPSIPLCADVAAGFRGRIVEMVVCPALHALALLLDGVKQCVGLCLTDEMDCLRGIGTENTTKADSPCPLQRQLFPVQVYFLPILGVHERTIGALVGQDV